MEPNASEAGTYPHAAAWMGGVLLAGIAVVTAALCGTIAILVRNAPVEPGARPIGDGPLSGFQIAGLVVLVVAGVGFAISHAASQERNRLPRAVAQVVAAAERLLLRIPLVSMLRSSLVTTTELSRLVAVVGPFASSAIAAAGTWLATGLGWRALLVGGAVAGAAAAGAAILVEPRDTSIQSGGMAVSLVVGAFAGFGFTSAAALIAVAGAVWIIMVAEVTDAVVQRSTAWVVVLVGGIALASSSVLAELDNTLGSLTVSGTQPRSFGDLAPLLDPLGAPERVRTVAATWLDFRTAVTAEARPGTIAPPTDLSIRSLYAVVDSAGFALAVALLLVAACAFLLTRLDASADGSRLRSIVTVTRFTIPVLFAVDVAENLSGAAAVLPHGLSRSATGSDLSGVSGLADAMAVLHWAMSLSKWVIIAGAVLAIVAATLYVVVGQRKLMRLRAGTAGEREDSESDGTAEAPPLATAWRSVRAHVVLVVVLAFAVRNAQAMDAVRLLATDSGLDVPGVAVLASAIAVLAVAIRYLAELVGREVGRLVYVPDERAPATARGRVRAAVFGFVGEPETRDDAETDRRIWFGGGIGALAAVMAAFLDAPGLLIPVGIWVVVELLSIPLRPAPDVEAAARRRRRAGKRFAVVTAGVVLLVGAAWPLHCLLGAAGVRWLLAALGAAATFLSLIQLIPFSTVRSSWFGFRPVLRTCCGLIPFCRVIVPDVARRCVVAARWFVRSVLRRLVLPGVWLLERIGVRSALTRALGFCERVAARFVERLTGRSTRSDEPTAGGAAPPDDPDQPAPLPSGPANAALTALHAASIGRVLGALVPMLIGAAVMRSALGLLLYVPQRNGGTWLLLVGAGLVLAGPLVHGLPRLRTAAWGRGDGIAAVSLALSALFVTYLVGWQLIEVGDVIESSRQLGALGVLALGLAMLAVVVTTIAYLGDATVALPSLDLLRIRRSPFFAFALVWLLVAGVLDGGGYHSIDTRPTVAGAERATVTARTAFEQWAAECARPADGREAVPMVFVAATGGGIRAGYWTARALERFDEHAVAIRGEDDPCRQPIFAASGASGGSVGLATYAVQHLVDADGNPERIDADGDGDPDGVADRLSEDYLAPTVAWMLMADLVRPFFLWDANGDATTDRAGVLERAMQGSWTPTAVDGNAARRCGPTEGNPDVSIASGLRELWCLGSPLVILNGAEVNSACRFNASVLDNSTAVRRPNGIVPPSPSSCRRTPVGVGTDDVGRGPLGATIDLHDYLCEGQDVAMSTAALLSARFPFITPSGRVPACDGTGLGTSYVVDGGYLDNSGSASLVELWAEVSTYVDEHNAEEGAVCIVPFFIQIDNGYEFDSGASPGRPSELTLPLSTVFASRGSRESEAKQVAASIFSTPAFSGDRIARDAGDRPLPRWARIVPDAHPGVQAPLGWALSDAARADLDEQLDRELDPEDGAFAAIDRWLDPGIDCGQ